MTLLPLSTTYFTNKCSGINAVKYVFFIFESIFLFYFLLNTFVLLTGNDVDDEDKTYEPDLSESDSSEDEQHANDGSAAVGKRNEERWKRNRASKFRNSRLEGKDRKANYTKRED